MGNGIEIVRPLVQWRFNKWRNHRKAMKEGEIMMADNDLKV